MECNIVSIDALRQRGQWKVEFFIDPSTAIVSQIFSHAKIGEIVEERRERLEPQSYPDHLFAYVGLEHVEPLTGDLVNCLPTLGMEIKSSSKVFRQGDVLYGRLRPILNKVLVADERLAQGICSGEFHVLKPIPDKVGSQFLRFLLASLWIQDIVAKLQSGSTHPRLSIKDLLSIEVPLPPIKDQAIIMHRVQSLDRERKEAKRRAAALPQYIADTFSEFLTNASLDKELPDDEELHPLQEMSLPRQYELKKQPRRGQRKVLSRS